MPRARVLLLALVLLLSAPAAALADGDPASDVLLGQNVFYPYSPVVSNSLQQTLNAETAAAAKDKFPIKVALIAAPVDLGVIPDLFGKPQQYADFLDQEISFEGAKQPLLVVMAAGYGVQGIPPSAQATLATIPKPAGRQTNALAQAAITAVAKLAKAGGHPVQGVAGVPGSSSGGGTRTTLVVVLALAALITAGSLAAVTLRRRRATA